MSTEFTVNAELRTDVGKGASRRLRRAGKLPGIVYGAHKEPTQITLAHNEIIRHLEEEAFYSHLLNLQLGGKTEKVVLKDLQRHPAKPFIMHMDFQRVQADEKIVMHIPIHFINEEKCPGVKAGGNASHQMTEVDLTCLPKDLPEFIEVDMSGMEIGDAIHLYDLKLPKGVEHPSMDGENYIVVNILGAHSGGEEEEEGGEEEAPE